MIEKQWCANVNLKQCEHMNCDRCEKQVPQEDPYVICRGCKKLEDPNGCDEECKIIPN